MKIRLLSDLHIDINDKYPLDLHKDKANDVFTLVAGDVSGYPHKTVDWLKRNIHRGAFICGNHDVYDGMPIEDIKSMYHKEFPESSLLTFFDNDIGVVSKEIDDGILLVADVLYTDYALPVKFMNGDGNVKCNMHLADPWLHRNGGMNDFNYGRCRAAIVGVNDSHKMKEGTWRLVPQVYLDHHKRAFEKITEIVEANKDKKVILMAHHGLSPKCLDINYDNGELDASYVSDKEKWIEEHPNIKFVFSGHIHCRKTFNIGSTVYAMNALGYCSKHLKQRSQTTGNLEQWTPDCFVDTDTWKVEWDYSKKNEEWEKQAEADYDRMMKLMPFFM